jgi:hypothetical protein
MCEPCTMNVNTTLMEYRYNGTSDLQLERMNVYFNEVCLLTSLTPRQRQDHTH